jgi:short-subunit dehydrogenase
LTPFRGRYGPWALVAGASEGLGAAFALEAAARGLDVLLVARRARPLGATAELLRTRFGARVRTVAADLGEPATLAEVVPAATADIDVGLVVANAAYAPVGPFLDLDPDTALRVLRVNAWAPLALARRYLPPMVERRRGGFVIVSSTAGLQGSPALAAYAATKAFGRILAEGLWAEVRPSGVDVLACVAGAVQTPGLARAATRRAPGTIPAARVAAEVYDRLGRGPVVVPGRFMRAATAVLGVLPRRTAVALMGHAAAGLTPGPPAGMPDR